MSLELLNAFKYYKKNTFVHNLDPRTKLFFAVVYAVIALFFLDIIPLLIIFLTLIPLLISSRLMKQWFKSIKSLSFLYLLIIILNTLFYPNYGLSFAISMLLRIIIMLTSFSIFFLTVDPNDLALSFIKMKIPYEYAFSFSLAYRFVPTIAIEARNIIDAQQSRGYEMQKKGIISQIKNLFPLLIPLIVNSIKRAFNVAEALESRAFGSENERSFYFDIRMSIKDILFIIYLILLLIAFVNLIIFINTGGALIYCPWLVWGLPV